MALHRVTLAQSYSIALVGWWTREHLISVQIGSCEVGLNTWRRKIKFQNNPREWVSENHRKARHDFIIHTGWGNDGKMRSERRDKERMRGGRESNVRK